MRTLQYGDIVHVNGYENGYEATVINPESEDRILVQMGAKTLYFKDDDLTVVARTIHDKDGNRFHDNGLLIGDNVKYIYPNPPSDPIKHKQPIRYGIITRHVSDKRLAVHWVGMNTDKIERIGRLKWVPKIPEWFIRFSYDEIE